MENGLEREAPMMTPGERKIVDMLADTYNAFCDLPREHPMEVAEFAQCIHELQHLVAARPTWRALASETIGDGVVRPR